MKILFLGDVVGISGRSMVLNNLLSKIKDEKIIEAAADEIENFVEKANLENPIQ